ncbi:MAG: PadR family transcriptional regulator [Anaerolineae bacterium]
MTNLPPTEHPLPLKNAELHILLVLARHDAHGYAMMQEVSERTGGIIRLGPGTLYTTLKRLVERGWIEEIEAPAHATDADDPRRRVYHLTDSGREILAAEVERLSRLVAYASALGMETAAR